MVPPFVPDLSQNNFDSEDIKVDIDQIMSKLKQDLTVQEFETHFSNEFTFINPSETLDFIPRCARVNEIHKTVRKRGLIKSSSAPSVEKNKFNIPLPFRSSIKSRQNRSLDKSALERRSSQKSRTLQLSQRYNVDRTFQLQRSTKTNRNNCL